MWKVCKFYAHNKGTDKWVIFANIEGWFNILLKLNILIVY
jgi:hypothetical protein